MPKPNQPSQTVQTIQADFDQLAALGVRDFDHNQFYHPFLLRQLPARCRAALDVGCGTGEFSRLLAARADRVLAVDLSPGMLNVARQQSAAYPNLEYRLADVRDCEFQAGQFDCIVSLATLHHLPLAATLAQFRAALQPGGTLAILDLFEAAGLGDFAANLVALPLNGVLRLLKTGRLRPPRELREAWEAHGRTDHYLPLAEIRRVCAAALPGAAVRQHLFWRYSIIWHKPE